jgi:hypothetical protein
MLRELWGGSPAKQREQIILSSLKLRIPIKQGSSLCSGSTTYENIEVKLSTGGPNASHT